MQLSSVRAQAGFTIIEVLAALFLFGTTVLAATQGLMVLVQSSDSHREVVASATEATRIAESIVRLPYVDCVSGNRPPVAYASALTGTRSGYNAEISNTVGFPTVTTGANGATASFTDRTDCPSPDPGVQRMTVRVRRSGTAEWKTVVVTKRRADCGTATANTSIPGETC